MFGRACRKFQLRKVLQCSLEVSAHLRSETKRCLACTVTVMAEGSRQPWSLGLGMGCNDKQMQGLLERTWVTAKNGIAVAWTGKSEGVYDMIDF